MHAKMESDDEDTSHEEANILWKYLHPFSLIDQATELLWPFVESQLESISDDVFLLSDKMFNLVAVLSIHHSFQNFSWGWFSQILMMLGIFKQILLRRRAKISTSHQQRSKSAYENSEEKTKRARKYQDSNLDATQQKPRFDADKVEEFCIQDLKPSLDWLNRIILALWLNFRAYAKFKFLHQLWPKVKLKLADTALNNLEIHDFNIGDKPFRVNLIECISHSETEMIIDVEIAYDGSANITITYSQESLNVSIPVTLQKFCISNIKVRMVLKNLTDHIPFIGGVQLFFLESPIIDWQTADAAKVVDLPGLDTLLKVLLRRLQVWFDKGTQPIMEKISQTLRK